jgi:hypothetical protein
MASEQENLYEDLGRFGYGNLENKLPWTTMMAVVSQLSPVFLSGQYLIFKIYPVKSVFVYI